MNRRQFAQTVGLGAVAAATLAPAAKAASAARPGRSEKKDWAKERLKGLGSLVMPTFTPDFAALDEEAVRIDIRHRVKQGFTSISVVGNGANAAQVKRMWQLVGEEAAGKNVDLGALGGDFAELEKLGVKYTMISYPRGANDQTEEAVYATFRKIIDSTNLAIVLYGAPVASLKRFHASGIPVNVFDRLADHPNVVGIKLTHPMNPAVAYELCERLSDRLIMGPCNFDHLPVLAQNYKNVQWSGLWITDALQSPEKPYAVEMMDAITRHKMAEAMKLYWQMYPLVQGIYDLQAPLLASEGHPWLHMKYIQWATGGNGGLLPLKPAPNLPVLDAAGRETIKKNLIKAGITPVDRPEEEFLVGKAGFTKGIKAAQLSNRPLYV